MISSELYNEGHLVVAGIRVLEHQSRRPPTIDEVCQMLSMSLEQGHLICRKLEDLKILEIVEGSYGVRLFIRDHVKLEEIPKSVSDDKLGDAIRQFQNSRKAIQTRVASIQADQADKKKSLFSELEKKLKCGLEKKG